VRGGTQTFETVVELGPKRRAFIPLPFVPDDVWGAKVEHHVAGSVNGLDVRAVVEPLGEGFGIVLGPAWRRDRGIDVGDFVTVVLVPEGPQRDDLPDDFRAALESVPSAAEFFDGIAQFYRTAYLKWIDATKRRPEQRAARIAEVVVLLTDGIKQRP
jgi:hypothetical protein